MTIISTYCVLPFGLKLCLAISCNWTKFKFKLLLLFLLVVDPMPFKVMTAWNSLLFTTNEKIGTLRVPVQLTLLCKHTEGPVLCKNETVIKWWYNIYLDEECFKRRRIAQLTILFRRVMQSLSEGILHGTIPPRLGPWFAGARVSGKSIYTGRRLRYRHFSLNNFHYLMRKVNSRTGRTWWRLLQFFFLTHIDRD